MPSTQPLTVEQMDAQFGAPTPQTLIPTQTEAQSAPSTLTVEDMDRQFTQPNLASPLPLLHGVYNGAMRTVDKPAELVGDAMAKLGVSGALRNLLIAHGVSAKTANQLAPALDQSAVNDAANEKTFNTVYGNVPAAQVGNVLGQTAVVAPLVTLTGGLADAGANALGGALSDVAPVASRVIQGARHLLSGTAGAGMEGIGGGATHVASKLAQGAQIGAQAAAYTGQPVGQGAEYGAALAPAGALAGKVLGAAGVVGKNLLSPLTDMSATATQKAAANRLVQAFKADGLTPEQAISKVQELGQQGMLADAGGANVRSAAEAVASSPGSGSDIAQQALEGRASAQAGRVNQAVKDATGVGGNVHGEADQLIAQRAQAAAPLYEKALANPVVPNDKLTAQLQNPLVQKAMQDGASIAETNAAANGETFDPATYLNPDGSTPAAPTMQALDAAKQGLDDMLEKYRDPTTGKLNLDSKGRAINNLRASFVNNLDALNPDYAAARQAYAGPSQSLDAMNMGKRALTNDPEVNAKIVGNLSPGDKQFYLQGVTRALQNKIDSAQDGADVTRRIFGNDLIRNKIAAAFDDPAAFAKFQQQMEAESQFAQTRNAVLKGSPTARRLAGQADLSTPFADAGRQLVSGNVGSAAGSALRGVSNYLLQPSQAQSTALGRLMFTPGQTGVDQMQAALQSLQPGPTRQAINLLTHGTQQVALPAATVGTQRLYGH